jgi:ABC-type Fe3+-hydroxamate transport system substrate-binding protein
MIKPDAEFLWVMNGDHFDALGEIKKRIDQMDKTIEQIQREVDIIRARMEGDA